MHCCHVEETNITGRQRLIKQETRLMSVRLLLFLDFRHFMVEVCFLKKLLLF